MDGTPSESVLHWAATAVGTNATIGAMRSLHGAGSPWLLRVDHDQGTSEVILRIPDYSRVGPAGIATGAAALLVAEEHDVAAPRLIASDLDGRDTGVVLTLETALGGNSELPGRVSVERLREAGAAIARVHAVPLDPQRDLPLRTRPIQYDDYAMERRWATLYKASSRSEKPHVIEAMCDLMGWHADDALRTVSNTHSTPLLHLADDRVREYVRLSEATVFVHGDVWGGNMRWIGDTCIALIDWKTAGAGNPGVDLGELRMHMALQYGETAPGHVLEGWQRQSGREATHVPYWDIVAALNTPTDMSGWPGFDDQGRSLSAASVRKRRDEFLRQALDLLDR
jgi:aminoglycoside phosphotransferase (APT) family kinase protein